jgi:hypothetical protein
VKHSEKVAVSVIIVAVFHFVVAVSSLRGALCSPVAIQKLIKLLSLSWSWSFPRPLRERGFRKARHGEGSPLLECLCCFPFCRGSVVIARGALSPRGNPGTNKAFVVVVVFPSPLAGEGRVRGRRF